MPFGPHVTRDLAPGPRPTIVEHIAAARAAAAREGFRADAAAIFVGGPKTRAITLRPDEGPALAAYAAETGVRVVAHSTYAAPPFAGRAECVAFVAEELRACAAAGIEGLVVHLPAAGPAAVLAAAPALAAAVRAARGAAPVSPLVSPPSAVSAAASSAGAPALRLYLETPATTPRAAAGPEATAAGYAVPYAAPEKLLALFDALRAAGYADEFGLCVDTAHLHTSGVDLGSAEAAAGWLRRLDPLADRVPVVLHLNDSARPRGAGPDQHAALGAGHIWGPHRATLAASGLAVFVDWARARGLVAVLERKPPEDLAADYAALRTLAPESRI